VLWQWLNYALGKHIRSQSVQAVQVEDSAGDVIDYETKESVQGKSSMKYIGRDVTWRRKCQFVKGH
jgi:hypothetical protein